MNVEYGIKNFRVFDKDGARFTLKPITMLTGANCAGKSSLVKSIMLLKQYLDKAMADDFKRAGAYDISFTDQSININGIDTVINNKSEGYKDVVFDLVREGATDNVKYGVEYTFSSVRGDYFNNGWLKNIRFFCEIDGVNDVFLDADFEEGFPVFRKLDLSGNILKAFKRDMDLSTYFYNYGEFTKPYRTRKIYSEEKRLLGELANRIYDNPINRTLPFLKRPIIKKSAKSDLYVYRILPKREEERLYCSYHQENIDIIPYQKLYEINNLFYLPILEIIGENTAKELKEFLLDKELIKELYPIDKKVRIQGNVAVATINNEKWVKAAIQDYKGIVSSIIDDFISSELKTFNEYYSALVEEQLSHMNNCEAPKQDFYHKGFLDVVSALYSLPIDIPRSGNVRNTIIYFDKYNDVDVNLSRFQRAYFILSCLQRYHSRKEKIGAENDFSGQPIYTYGEEPSFMWKEKSEIYAPADGNKDVPVSKLFYNYVEYLNRILEQLSRIEDFQHISQYDSFLCPVQRSYSVYEKTPLNKMLVEYIGLREQRKAERRKWRVGFIDKWVKELGIGEAVLFKLNKEKTDIKIIVKDFSGNMVSSADLGHGVTQMLSILINIERHIYEKRVWEAPYTICIEEPEVSLHPSWQSTLGRIFYDAAVNYGIHFILETHSEYLIRATQAIVANTVNNETELKSIPFRVYYIENGGKAYDMEYQVSGRFKKPFGTGFFDEAGKSSLEIIRKERRMANGKDA